ncbi:CK1/CK1 protein kinase [Panus rudis PR-1116 ss-1]|nr:CK1/CK1 protein kinase [Panus rudis PR-1116 ss-1]
MPDPPTFPQRIGNWWLQECLGSGYSGSIFKAVNVHTRQIVALKIQHVDAECPTNRFERGFYPSLQGGKGMPTLWASGVEGPYDYLAIDLLGASLDSLFRKSGRDVMDLRSVCCIAQQVISRLEFMHGRGILHRDIQLGNCVIGLPPNDRTIYMIDFGFSKRYIDPRTNRHIPDSKVKRDFIGNYWFTSVGVHCRGKVPSRRDDMEAVALMLIHLLTPRGLSWTRNGVPKTDAAHDRLIREKRDARPEDLCRGLPPVFEEFLRYCRRLKFADCPDYDYWKEEFAALAEEHGYPASDEFIWPPPQPEPVVRAQTKPAPGKVNDLEKLLHDLVGLHVQEEGGGQRQVLGARNLNENQQKGGPPDAENVRKGARTDPDGVIVISSDDENDSQKAPAAIRLPKATHLAQIARTIPDATNNVALAKAVREFLDVLQSSRSRTLTKEGFAVLDALYKQLADPSVYIVPLRTSKSRGDNTNTSAENTHLDARRAKMNKLFALRRDVQQAKDNKTLAKLVAEFGAVIDRSNGRTVTKDAFGFLEGLATRLRALQA